MIVNIVEQVLFLDEICLCAYHYSFGGCFNVKSHGHHRDFHYYTQNPYVWKHILHIKIGPWFCEIMAIWNHGMEITHYKHLWGDSRGCLNIKMLSYQYIDSHYKFKTQSHECLIFITGIPIPGKAVFIMWLLSYPLNEVDIQHAKTHDFGKWCGIFMWRHKNKYGSLEMKCILQAWISNCIHIKCSCDSSSMF